MMKTTSEIKLVNAKEMLDLACKNSFAIPHININNLEWIQASLTAAMQAKSPIILGVSEGAAKYMGSFKVIHDMVLETMIALNCDVPVCLHLDHGTYQGCLKALEADFSSIMFDGSHLDFEENLKLTKELKELCAKKDVSLEVEVGAIGGEEDGVASAGELADVNQCEIMAATGIDMLAAGIGNIHGLYPANWKGLNFEVLKEISEKTQKPLVLHGGSGIPNDQIVKSIELGVRKINVNTECQLAFTAAIYKYTQEHPDFLVNKAYDPRKYLKVGKQAIVDTCIEKFKLFNSFNQVK